MKEVQAVLFDMDGVIYDTEKIFMRSFVEVGHRHDLENIEDFYRSIQGTNDVTTRMLFDERYQGRYPFDVYYEEVDEVIYQIRDGKAPPMKETVREFLTYLRDNHIPAALVSSTPSKTVLRDIKWSGIDDCFREVICGDMVTVGKPDPEGYLKAAARLGADPAYSYVVEDSHNGIRAAHNGGFHPIMIPDTMPVTEEMEQLCEAILPDMDALKEYLFGREG